MRLCENQKINKVLIKLTADKIREDSATYETSMVDKTQKFMYKLCMRVPWVKNYNFDLYVYLFELQYSNLIIYL